MIMNEQIYNLLKEIGPGKMSSTAYDTAWVARLGKIDWNLSSQALNWLCENQLPDGSWGAAKPFYYHDRVISTLAAMIALTHRGRRTQDRHQIEKGLLALESITGGATVGLAADPNGATVGFEMIVPTLVAEAENLGIIKQQGDRILGRMKTLREQKMSKLRGIKINRHLTPAFSAEMAGADGKNILEIENLQESNGSVGNSPSATAYFLSQFNTNQEVAFNYLRNAIRGRNGGSPFATPFDIFERAWILWNISLCENFMGDSEVHNLCKPYIQFLQKAWKPGDGVGFSTSYTPSDGDDTSITFESLARFGYLLDSDTLLEYESENYFRCYPLEANPSIGANVHMLGALKKAGFTKNHPAILKILRFLERHRISNRHWVDKWHISPYYITAHVIIAALEFNKDLCQKSIQWMIDTQKSDGSWGSFGFSTAEETSYCLQALIIWQKNFRDINVRNKIIIGTQWLEQHIEDQYPALWISKALYCPDLIVRSSILTALEMAKEID